MTKQGEGEKMIKDLDVSNLDVKIREIYSKSGNDKDIAYLISSCESFRKNWNSEIQKRATYEKLLETLSEAIRIHLSS